MATPPDNPTIRYVVDRVATVRRRRYQDDDRYRHYTEAAMLEQVCGVEGVLVDLGDGWWRVGVLVDVIAGEQLDVLMDPGEQKIRLRGPAPMPEPKEPEMLPEPPKIAPVSTERGSNPLKWDEW